MLKILYILKFCVIILSVVKFECQNAERSDISASEDSVTFLITGGYKLYNTTYEKFIVSISFLANDGSIYHFCAGSIIKPQVVLTAAHCFLEYGSPKRLEHERVIVIAGNPNRLNKTSETVISTVTRVVLHSLFELAKIKMDIAVVKLSKKFDFSLNNLDRAILPTQHPADGTKCIIFGWGRLYLDGPITAELVYADVTLQSMEECRKTYKNMDQTQLCAQNYTKKADAPDACEGDSGGPLVCDGILSGIISYGVDCGSKYPGVYTNIYEFRDWIERNAGKRINYICLQAYIFLYLVFNI